jgi:deoxyribose-phosphate aldolase
MASFQTILEIYDLEKLLMTNNADFEVIALHPHILDNDIDSIASRSVREGYGGLVVPPYWVKKASRETKNTAVQLFTVVGYPLGYQRTEAKQAEIELALSDGANGIGLTLNVSAIKSNRMHWIKAEIARFAKLLHEKEALLTVIIDWYDLTENEQEKICSIIPEAGADFVMNTPFSDKELTLTDVKKIKNLVHNSVGIKIYTSTTDETYYTSLFQNGANVVCLNI